jgi:hypothetical protein
MITLFNFNDFRTIIRLFLNFDGFLVDISLAKRHQIFNIFSCIKYQTSLTAESVTVSCDKTIGRELMITILNKFHFWFKGMCKRSNFFLTIFPPKNSCPWKVHPCFLLKRLVGAFPISCNKADHRSQTSSVFGQMLSTTSSVW